MAAAAAAALFFCTVANRQCVKAKSLITFVLFFFLSLPFSNEEEEKLIMNAIFQCQIGSEEEEGGGKKSASNKTESLFHLSAVYRRYSTQKSLDFEYYFRYLITTDLLFVK